MMRELTGFPGDVVAVEADGVVTAKDYATVLIPAVEKRLADHEGVRVLYRIAPSFERFEAGALWDDTLLGLRHWRAWRRIAVVCDVDWIRTAVRAFGFLMPGRVAVFSNDEFEAARAWIAEEQGADDGRDG